MALNLETLLTTKEVASMLGLAPGSLNVWRATKRYPLPYIKVGRHVRYVLSDVQEFLRSRTVAR
jgi:excisionase family DNA binding protein